MPNNFQRGLKDELLTNCVICKHGIYKKRHAGQYEFYNNGKITGPVHLSCVAEEAA